MRPTPGRRADRPNLEGTTATFTPRILDEASHPEGGLSEDGFGAPPARFRAVSLFIDDVDTSGAGGQPSRDVEGGETTRHVGGEGVRRQRSHSGHEVFLKASMHREGLRSGGCLSKFLHRQHVGQLGESEGVAAGVRHDPVGDPSVQTWTRLVGEQLMGRLVDQTADDQGPETIQGSDWIGVIVPQPEDQRDSLGLHPSPPEGECIERLAVDPLGVVDHAQQVVSSSCSVVGEADDPQPDEEQIGTGTTCDPQRGVECVSLGDREPLDLVEDRREQPAQRCVPQGTLGLDAGQTNDEEVVCNLDRVLDQLGLSDSGRTPNHEDLAPLRPRCRELGGDCPALVASAEELHAARTVDMGSRSSRATCIVLSQTPTFTFR